MHSFIANIVLNGLSPENRIRQKTAINTVTWKPEVVSSVRAYFSDALERAKGLDPNCHLKSLDMKHRVTASGVSKYDALPKREVIVLTKSREKTKQ